MVMVVVALHVDGDSFRRVVLPGASLYMPRITFELHNRCEKMNEPDFGYNHNSYRRCPREGVLT